MTRARMKIVAITGSLQVRSSNAALVRAALTAAPAGMVIDAYESLGELPYVNPEIDGDGGDAPAAVADLRARLQAADGALIASPEYGHSMPGVLKNALDWLVASGELSGLPVALISASTTGGGGIRAQMALTQTLLAQAANVVVALTVPGVRSKLDERGELSDPATIRRVRETLVALAEAVETRRSWLAST